MEHVVELLLEIKNEITASLLHGKEVLTLKEFSKYAGITLDQAYKITSAHKIKCYRPGGKMIYIDRQDMLSYLRQNPVENSSAVERKANDYFLTSKLLNNGTN